MGRQVASLTIKIHTLPSEKNSPVFVPGHRYLPPDLQLLTPDLRVCLNNFLARNALVARALRDSCQSG